MAETQTLAWDEVFVDESITEEDHVSSENLAVETPVGKFICTVIECTAQENAMKAYTCYAANLKMRIDDVLEIEQPVIDDKGAKVKRNGETLYKKMPVAADKKVGVNALYAGRFLFDMVNLANIKEKDAMKKRRLFIAKKLGIISPQATKIEGRDWAGAVGLRVIIDTEWNSWTDKNTGELKKNVKVAWAGYDYAPAVGSDGEVVADAGNSDEDFSDI